MAPFREQSLLALCCLAIDQPAGILEAILTTAAAGATQLSGPDCPPSV